MAENLTLIDDSEVSPKSNGPWEKLVREAIETCPKIKKEREKTILYARFGIGKTSKTLDAIGKSLGITRERIRQIVVNAIKKIQKNCASEAINSKISQIEDFVKKSGGYVSETNLYSKFAGAEEYEHNAVKLVASLSKNLEFLKESNDLKSGWNANSLKQNDIRKTSEKIVEVLNKNKKILSAADIQKEIGGKVEEITCILTATKAVMKTDDGKWGLASWPHVNPKSIKDKSKYIISRHGKPIHYAELANLISQMNSKKVTKQSVHNELIKSDEFVLVGRGIYALVEWGYKPGVVEEVIVEILEEAGEPLHKSEIVKKVLEKRIVKVSTVVLNLQKDKFKRVGKGIYTLN